MTYRIADIVTTTPGTGTISSSGTTLTGSGTNFDPEIVEGSIIHAAGQTLVIATRTNDTAAAVVTAPSPALAGATFTITTMTAVASLTADSIDPLGSFSRWVEVKNLGNGLARATGRPMASWLWKNIGVNQRTSLKAICTGKSVRVYICTVSDPNTNTFTTYQAAMLWPDDDVQYNKEFSISFRDLVAL